MTEIDTETELRAVTNGANTVVICFHSSRSTYSRRTVQTLTELKDDYPETKFCLVDADRDIFLPLLLEFGVVGLPTILIYRAGVQAKCLIGERSKNAFLTLLNNCLFPTASA